MRFSFKILFFFLFIFIESYSNNYNYIFKSNLKNEGIVVIFPKLGNTCVQTELECNVDDKFYAEGYNVLIIEYNHLLALDQNEFEILFDFMAKILPEKKNQNSKFIIGGFSSGGNIALSYSIWVKKNKKNKFIPTDIFIGDSPLDLEYLYKNKISLLSNSKNLEVIEQAKYLVNFLDYYYGDPSVNREKYLEISPYIKSKGGKNINYILDYNIILFVEPNVSWYKKKYNYNYDNMNAFVLESFFKEVRRKSKHRVCLIKTKNKGLDIKGHVNPHSWSIIDGNILFNWIVKKVESEKPEKE